LQRDWIFLFMENEQETTNIEQQALELATEAGHILLENGAEISRVEETMERIASHYNVDSENFFVLSNGIFTTGRNFANVEYIPFKGTQLDKVVAVNQISRDIEKGRYTLDEAREALHRARRMPPKPFWEQVLASALGSAGFCIIFGGSFVDSLVAFVAGLLLYVFVLKATAPYLSKIFSNICGASFVTLFCLLAFRAGFGDNLSNIIIGAVIPLIPGVPFTNGIRDIAGEDYIAGITRLLDATMVFFCIALGVSLVFLIDGRLSGGVIALEGMGVNRLTAAFPIQLAAALVGSAAFAVLFGVPRKYYWHGGVCGMIGWVVYLVMLRYAGSSVVEASGAATIAVALTARELAVWQRCPMTVFLICGIFPLVPGAGIYWTSYYVISGQLHAALTAGFTAIKVVIAIIFGIVFTTDVIFRLLKRRRKKNRRQTESHQTCSICRVATRINEVSSLNTDDMD